MRRLLVLGTLSLLLTAACAAAAQNPPAARPSGVAASTVDPSHDVPVYVAVLRRYLTTPQENSNLTFATVFVVNYRDVGAADPMRTAPSATTTPISTADQQTIVAALHDVAPVQFVASRDQVIIHNTNGCAVVRDNGILILLGPTTQIAGTIQVGINGFVGCLGATWFTYVVAPHAGGWVVTGTTGPVAIS
jgi:hypothetical protein